MDIMTVWGNLEVIKTLRNNCSSQVKSLMVKTYLGRKVYGLVGVEV